MGTRVLTLLVLIFALYANFEAQQNSHYYRVQLLDKSHSNFDVDFPDQFLSQRAIDRRNKQGIAIVENDLPISSFYSDSILNLPSVSYQSHSKWLNTMIIVSNDTNDINLLNSWSFVVSANKTKIAVNKNSDKLEIEANFVKADITVNSHYPYGLTYNQNHLHSIDYMHDIGFRGQGMHIALIDAGFERTDTITGLAHLFEDNRILSTRDFVAHDGDVYSDHYHGTAVLSTIAGKIDGVFSGTAPEASFHLLRSEDANAEYIMEEDYWVSAAEYADSVGVDIINSSLGYTQFDDPSQNHTYADLDGNTTIAARGADIAASKGILICVSAGNSGANSWGYISTPADADSILTVGAVDSLGNRAPFSSYGYSADGDIKPNVVSVGWFTYLFVPWGDVITQSGGTSFSSPMMAGMSACLWQALPDKSNMEIKQLIEESSHQYHTPDSLMGYGIPNFYDAYEAASGQSYLLSKPIKIHKLYPNPVSIKDGESINLLLGSYKEQTLNLDIINVLGENCFRTSFNVLQGNNLVTISDLPKLAIGSYEIRINDEHGMYYPTTLVVR